MANKKSPPKVRKPPAKNKGGRPTKYNDDIPRQVQILADRGWIDEEIAELIGVSKRTLYFWKNRHEEFFHAIKGGKAPADDLVEVTLFRRAMGYSEEVVRTKIIGGKMVEFRELMIVPPDPTCMIFWLKNRRPEEWREKIEMKTSDDITLNIKIGHDDDADGEPQPDVATSDTAAKKD